MTHFKPLLAASAACFAIALTAPAAAQDVPQGVQESEQANFEVHVVAEGLEFPWSITFLPGGDMLVTEREGRLRVIRGGVLDPEPLAGVPDDLLVERQGGLMEIALDPDFASNRMVWFSYAAGTPQANHTALARARLNAAVTALEDVEVVFRARPDSPRGFHFGGKIDFLPDGTLLLSLGDAGLFRDEAQNLRNHLGTIVRLHRDGSVPDDNPFTGRDDAAPEIYTWGHRNVQGLAVHPETGVAWSHEHGPRGGDEVNILTPGLNYGWPVISYGINYDGSIVTEHTAMEGMEQPAWYWGVSPAVSGMAFYDGDAFPEWRGDLFIGALAGMRVIRFELDGDRLIGTEDLLSDMGMRIRDVRAGPDGFLYLATDDIDGMILRLQPPAE